MKNLTYILLKLSLVAFALTLSVDASATRYSNEKSSLSSLELNAKVSNKRSHTPIVLQLSQSKNIRSRGDAIREVKRRYDAEILRIKLNEKRTVYQVRVLMPNGKVKNVTVSARR